MQLLMKVTALFALAVLSATVLRRTRASVRHLPVACAFVALPVLVLTALIVPTLPVELATGSASLPVPAAVGRGAGWLPIVWLTGAVIVLLRVVVGLIQVRRLRRSGVPWPETQALARLLAAENGVTRPMDGDERVDR